MVTRPLDIIASSTGKKVSIFSCESMISTTTGKSCEMLPCGKGNIFVTGATASLRGGSGFAAFAGAKFGLRTVAQSVARELGPKNIHVAHLIIDSSVDTEWVRQLITSRGGPQAMQNLDPNRLMRPAAVAGAYWQLYQQPRDAWTFEHEIRPFGEKW
jgi:NAD(P)-dependent dehydrogenase (short-subunit alcohol dehydrogenase family)